MLRRGQRTAWPGLRSHLPTLLTGMNQRLLSGSLRLPHNGGFVGGGRHRRATRGRAATLLSPPKTCPTVILSGRAVVRHSATPCHSRNYRVSQEAAVLCSTYSLKLYVAGTARVGSFRSDRLNFRCSRIGQLAPPQKGVEAGLSGPSKGEERTPCANAGESPIYQWE